VVDSSTTKFMNKDKMNKDRIVKIKASTIESIFQQVVRKMIWVDANPIVELLRQFEEIDGPSSEPVSDIPLSQSRG